MSGSSSRRPWPPNARRLVVLFGAITVVSVIVAVAVLVSSRPVDGLPQPKVVGHAVPVVEQGRAVNFTVLGRIANPGGEDLVGDIETTASDTGPVLRDRVRLDDAAGSWGGWMFTHGYFDTPGGPGRLDWGAHAASGYNLTGATSLTVVARGGHGGETVELFTAGQGYDPASGQAQARWADSTNKIGQTVTLTDQFATYDIPLAGHDLSYLGNGFGFVVAADGNPGLTEVVVDLAQVRIDLPNGVAPAAFRDVWFWGPGAISIGVAVIGLVGTIGSAILGQRQAQNPMQRRKK